MMEENALPPMKKLEHAFAHWGLTHIFTLKKRYGNGFLAIEEPTNPRTAAIVRMLPSGKIKVRPLEHPSDIHPPLLDSVSKWAQVDFIRQTKAFNFAGRKLGFKWSALILKEALQTAALAEQGTVRVDPEERQLIPGFHMRKH